MVVYNEKIDAKKVSNSNLKKYLKKTKQKIIPFSALIVAANAKTTVLVDAGTAKSAIVALRTKVDAFAELKLGDTRTIFLLLLKLKKKVFLSSS